MSFLNRSLRSRIFLSMILLVIGASVLIVVVTVFQYRENTNDYHRERLIRKETAIRENIDYVIKNTSYAVETDKIPLIFKNKNYEIKDIHKIDLFLYDLEGNILISSKPSFTEDTLYANISNQVLVGLKNSSDKHYIEKFIENKFEYQSSFSYITDHQYKPIAILNLPYFEDDDFLNYELKEYLWRLGFAYILMLLFAVVLAYFLSTYITRSLNSISNTIK